jgi:hypothetical protein
MPISTITTVGTGAADSTPSFASLAAEAEESENYESFDTPGKMLFHVVRATSFHSHDHCRSLVQIVNSKLCFSASSTISKGQGYQGFLRKRAAVLAKKGQFASYKEKLGQNFTTFRVNKMFSHKF